MKALYKTPEIKYEVLEKADVLCASNEAPDLVDNRTIEDAITYFSNLESFM